MFCNNVLSHEKSSITKEFGSFFKHTFSSLSYSPVFLSHRESSVFILHTEDNSNNCMYNLEFQQIEFNLASQKSRGSFPDPDGIHYMMLKNLPNYSKTKMLQFYNYVWIYRVFLVHEICRTFPSINQEKNISYFSSCRPIFLSNTVSKIMQRLM